jgi:hypothetical protein
MAEMGANGPWLVPSLLILGVVVGSGFRTGWLRNSLVVFQFGMTGTCAGAVEHLYAGVACACLAKMIALNQI